MGPLGHRVSGRIGIAGIHVLNAIIIDDERPLPEQAGEAVKGLCQWQGESPGGLFPKIDSLDEFLKKMKFPDLFFLDIELGRSNHF